jgi:hypothetical protein
MIRCYLVILTATHFHFSAAVTQETEAVLSAFCKLPVPVRFKYGFKSEELGGRSLDLMHSGQLADRNSLVTLIL